MSEALTLARFAELAQAYGGEIARWPAEVQDAARRMADQPEARALLAEEADLDARLDLWTVAAPSPQLRQAVAASWQAPLGKRVRLWWSALGLGAALAGAGAGLAFASLSGVALPSGSLTPSSSFEATAFGDFSPGEG
ncbi:hypothetical protein [Novosphingobium rosa]|uniref:hypothetical protein n=1 Tax=Novosphingobium rosa TaxID=76978 RepID=UPI000830D5EB|nr:hypothetical protein [Novosphingobium rosa]